MFAKLLAPELFSACILVSSNPGLSDPKEREVRLSKDLEWAGKFRETSWMPLMAEWDVQAVFAGHPQMARRESDYSRVSLARAMDIWSLGRQEDLKGESSIFNESTLLVSGGKDTKFRKIADRISRDSKVQHRVLEGAGHRVPWDQPSAFADLIRDFLAQRGLTSR